MSYAIKYTGSLVDYYGRTLRVDILEQDYTGGSETVTLAGVDLTFNGDDENLFKRIFSTSVSFGLTAFTDFQFIDLYTGSKRKFQVKIYRSAVLYWVGWLVPDLYTEVYDAPTYITTITARDGLVELETLDFDLVGVLSQSEILQRAITKITDDPNDKVYVGVNTFETNHVTTESPLSQTWVDCERFEGKTYEEVLLDLCDKYYARVYQKAGSFWFVSTFEMGSPFFYTIYNGPETVIGTGTYDNELLVGIPQVNKFCNNDQQLNILPPWKEANAFADLGYISSFLENSDFEEWSGNTAENWSGSSSDQLIKYTQKDNTVAVFAKRNSSPSDNNFIRQTITNVTGQLHGLKLTLDFDIVKDTGQSLGQFWIKIENDGATSHYLKTTSTGLVWTTTESYINFQNIAMSENEDQIKLQSFSANSKGLNASLAEIPVDGSIIVTIYAADKGFLILDNFELTIISYPFGYASLNFFGSQFLSPSFNNYDDSEIEYNYPYGSNSYVPEDVNLLTSDLPNKYYNFIDPKDYYKNERLVYLGGMFLDSGKVTPTHIWQYGSTPIPPLAVGVPLIQSVQYSITSLVNQPYWAITGTLLTQDLELDSGIVDYQTNAKKYLVNNGDFDMELCQFNGTYIQIGASDNADPLCIVVNSSGDVSDNGIHDDTQIWVD